LNQPQQSRPPRSNTEDSEVPEEHGEEKSFNAKNPKGAKQDYPFTVSVGGWVKPED
jgi:hypothetical protein